MNNLLLLLSVGALVGASSGYLGSFMVMKRMSLVGDALSHVALPGIAIALAAGINPMFGAVVALFLAVIGIWYFEEHTQIYAETLVGVFFTASLAIGILITPEPELLEALFGNIETIGWPDAVITLFASAAIFGITYALSKRLVLSIVSPELAHSTGIKTKWVNLVYLLLVGLVVALGVKFVGTILTGALVIVPAAAAKNIARNMKGFQYWAALLGLVSAVFGILVASALGIPSGPAVVLTSALLFVISYWYR